MSALDRATADETERPPDPSAFGVYYARLQHQQNMLQDVVRTDTYRRAIVGNADDFRGKVVLDVGAGTGILSFFAAQAGAMVTLANVTAVLIASSSGHGRIGLSTVGLDTWAIGLLDMYNILATLLQQQYGPHAMTATDEVLAIAAQGGWYASGIWQVPPGAVVPSDPPASERQRNTRS